MGGLLRPNMRG